MLFSFLLIVIGFNLFGCRRDDLSDQGQTKPQRDAGDAGFASSCCVRRGILGIVGCHQQRAS